MANADIETQKRELIENLDKALNEYILSSPDHVAMKAARDLQRLLKTDPEKASEDISKLFDGPKTAVTDAFLSTKTKTAMSRVSEERKALGNFFAKQRMAARNKS